MRHHLRCILVATSVRVKPRPRPVIGLLHSVQRLQKARKDSEIAAKLIDTKPGVECCVADSKRGEADQSLMREAIILLEFIIFVVATISLIPASGVASICYEDVQTRTCKRGRANHAVCKQNLYSWLSSSKPISPCTCNLPRCRPARL